MEYSQAIMRLQQCGFTQEQVEAIVAYNEAATKTLATVHDLRLTESQLKHEIQQVKTEIHKLENRLTLRMGAMAIFIVGVLGAMKFFA